MTTFLSFKRNIFYGVTVLFQQIKTKMARAGVLSFRCHLIDATLFFIILWFCDDVRLFEVCYYSHFRTMYQYPAWHFIWHVIGSWLIRFPLAVLRLSLYVALYCTYCTVASLLCVVLHTLWHRHCAACYTYCCIVNVRRVVRRFGWSQTSPPSFFSESFNFCINGQPTDEGAVLLSCICCCCFFCNSQTKVFFL